MRLLSSIAAWKLMVPLACNEEGVRYMYMCACAVDIGLEYALIRIGCCVVL